MTSLLDAVSNELIRAVEDDMRSMLEADGGSNPLFYNMLRYHLGWTDQDFQPTLSDGGKRVRPLLCLLSAQAAGGRWKDAVPAGSALELLHNFSLIHDDIQDSSPTRRGRPTLWKLWGINQAINSGDAMYALAHIAICNLEMRSIPSAIIVHATRRLDETCIQLTIGQHADMHFEEREDVSVAEYLTMIDGKTAALISLSTELGAMIAGAERSISDHYAAFGLELGRAFQIRDDILGIWGDESVIGKSAATDIVTRKKSLPVLYGLEQSKELRAYYFSSNDDEQKYVKKVTGYLDRIGARDHAKAFERQHAESALDHLRAANPMGDAGSALQDLTLRLLNRQA